MDMFELVATLLLKASFYAVVGANAFRLVPARSVNACGADLRLRIVLTHQYLVLTALAAGTLLLAVKIGVLVGWNRRLLRGILLLAVALSFVASVLAVVTFEDGFLYQIGCHANSAGYGAGAPLGVMVMGLSALVHGSFAWSTVTEN